MIYRKKIALSVIAAAALVIPLALGTGTYVSASSTPVSAGSGQGVIVFHSHRISSPDWAPCFAVTCDVGTGPGATMYFVVYNSAGALIAHGFADESGTQITGLDVGQTYDIYPADCDLCHNSTHNVVFDHWGDNSTVRPRPFTVTSSPLSVDAYFKIVELGAGATTSTSSSSTTSTGTTITPPPQTQPPVTPTVTTPPPATVLPPVGNAGKEDTETSILQILGVENVVVVVHGKEVFKVPLEINAPGHINIHINTSEQEGQAIELQKHVQDEMNRLFQFSMNGHDHAKGKHSDNNNDQGDNGDN